MKKKKKMPILTLVLRALPNLCIVMSCMMITFLIINHYNRSMNFVNNSITARIQLALMFVSVAVSIIAIVYQRKYYSLSHKECDDNSGKKDEEKDGDGSEK